MPSPYRPKQIVLNGCLLTSTSTPRRPGRCLECRKYESPSHSNHLNIEYCLDRIAVLDWPGWTCKPATNELKAALLDYVPPLPKRQPPRTKAQWMAMSPEARWTGTKCGCKKRRKHFRDDNKKVCKACLAKRQRAYAKECWQKELAARKQVRGVCRECGKKFEPYKSGSLTAQYICKPCLTRKRGDAISLGKKNA